MAWTTPLSAVSNATLTAAQWNASVRDDLAETAPAKATAAGQMFVSTAANAIAARTPGAALVATGQTSTTTATYGDLTTVGPAYTCTTGTQAFVSLYAQIENSTAGGGGNMSFAVAGATTIAASDDRAIRNISAAVSERTRLGITILQTLLNVGSNTFTAKYTTPTGGTATFTDRRLAVLPL